MNVYLERLGAAGLVIDHHERAPGAIDPVGATAEPDLAAIGQPHPHRPVLPYPERKLRPHLHPPGLRPHQLVIAEQQLEIGGNPVALLPPQQRMAGHSPALQLRGHLQHHAVKRTALRGGPPLPATRHRARA